MKTGIFSGSFNPIHTGHLMLANYLCQYHGFEEIFFVVSPHNPLKACCELASEEDRLAMVALAIEEASYFQNIPIEMELPRPSYTIHTLEALTARYPDREFHLIIGSDNWALFDQWKSFDRIKTEFKLCVYPRKGFPIRIEEADRENVYEVEAPRIDLSSSFIRAGIAAGKEMRFFVPDRVYLYLKEHRLYETNTQRSL